MPKMRKKADLPVKVCLACGRPFAWRKTWRAVWDEVKTCSERCKRDHRRKSADRPVAEAAMADAERGLLGRPHSAREAVGKRESKC